jgi:hypothetical protein
MKASRLARRLDLDGDPLCGGTPAKIAAPVGAEREVENNE